MLCLVQPWHVLHNIPCILPYHASNTEYCPTCAACSLPALCCLQGRPTSQAEQLQRQASVQQNQKIIVQQQNQVNV